ncbi:DUF1196 domain-containing protein [Vibrio cholerae]|nr:DUF1196 domain-containing protein [Vibrio cholerae]MVB48410.1 DUF1196 domain-containing protein [Vibrio cholerae]MVB59664.1 DUF1196 domain-containing protein [Vibrio cholerae]MVC02476.1 DUF1196 domain-containing protein [Vibrio cholerae]MVC35854.1 DUF1196 domain-containing protein [Vibrio cholerae]
MTVPLEAFVMCVLNGSTLQYIQLRESRLNALSYASFLESCTYR